VSAPLFVEADTALGAWRGDVDDGFALAALWGALAQGRVGGLLGVGSVWGNTAEGTAARCNAALAAACGYTGPLPRGAPGRWRAAGGALSESAGVLAAAPDTARVVALGPLSTVAAALAARGGRPWAELVVVGANRTSRGRLPPLWPHEFNLTQDRAAFRHVFHSGQPLTLLPLDVAATFLATPARLAALPGPVGALLRRGARRWAWRSLLRRGSRAFPLWDVPAVLHALGAPGLRLADVPARLTGTGAVAFGEGARGVRVVERLDAPLLWEGFLGLLPQGRAAV
jgi:inosine-uridine nucleoside N-ribohydrolase